MKKPSTPVATSATLLLALSGCPVVVGDVAEPVRVGDVAEETDPPDDAPRLRPLAPPKTDVRDP